MLTPKDETDLADVVRSATDPLAIQGGGTQGVAIAGAPLTTLGISGITTYEPGALTLVAKAGTPLAEINAALATENQMLAFEPMDHRPLLGTTGEPTIGGVVAANVSGPRRVQAGACRDFLLGVRFVDGQGDVVQNGGRVMKNVTGYDLARLMCGAHGTLGILTEVSFKVLPKPKAAATLMIYGASVEDAVRLMSRALCSPFEISGAAFTNVSVPVTLLRLEGSETQVTYRLGELRKLLGKELPTGAEFGAYVALDLAKTEKQWTSIRDLDDDAGTPNDVWRLSVKPSDAPGVCKSFPDGTRYTLDWGGGLIWSFVEPGTNLRAHLGTFSGHVTLVKGQADLPRFHPEGAVQQKLALGLRQKFDPRGILNPGLMG